MSCIVCLWGGSCAAWYGMLCLDGSSWRLAPDGNDSARPVNIENNICVFRLDVRFGMHRGSEALILFL